MLEQHLRNSEAGTFFNQEKKEKWIFYFFGPPCIILAPIFCDCHSWHHPKGLTDANLKPTMQIRGSFEGFQKKHIVSRKKYLMTTKKEPQWSSRKNKEISCCFYMNLSHVEKTFHCTEWAQCVFTFITHFRKVYAHKSIAHFNNFFSV